MIETFSSKVSKREWQALNGGGGDNACFNFFLPTPCLFSSRRDFQVLERNEFKNCVRVQNNKEQREMMRQKMIPFSPGSRSSPLLLPFLLILQFA